MKRKKFLSIMYNHSKNTIESNRAWSVYLRLYKLFKDNDKDTIGYLEDIGAMSKIEKLKWRNRLASEGFEFTPDQIDDYILILSLAITERWKTKK